MEDRLLTPSSSEILIENFITKGLMIKEGNIWPNLLWRNHSQTCIPIQVNSIIFIYDLF